MSTPYETRPPALPLPTRLVVCEPLYKTAATKCLPRLCSSVPDQISAVGERIVGVIPPIARPAPAMPPAASKQGAVGQSGVPASCGNVNPNGGVLLVPWRKTGWLPGALDAEKVGKIKPGGLPRYCSWTFAGVSQFENVPKPPRITQSPLPVTSQAAPRRGVAARGVRSNA